MSDKQIITKNTNTFFLKVGNCDNISRMRKISQDSYDKTGKYSCMSCNFVEDEIVDIESIGMLLCTDCEFLQGLAD